MEIEPFMLASSVLAVMGLRLVRKNCPHCSAPYEPAPSQLKVVPESLMAEARFQRGAGCDQCNQTGYSGRMPVSELLVAKEPFREAVLKKVPTSALEEIAVQEGMRTLWQSGLARALSGESTLEEIIRVVAADMI
jgi:type II secretory ATPase GspE/PulE/Tfp pilus assembly ATPase PilB-like protein